MHSPAFLFGVCLWLGGGLAAVVVGGPPERFVGAAVLANLVIALLLVELPRAGGVQWWSLGLDVLTLVVIAGSACVWPRRWLWVAFGFQLVGILVHVPPMLDARIHEWAYAALNNLCGYAVVLALVTGVGLHRITRGRAHAGTGRL